MTDDAIPQRTLEAVLDELIPARDAVLPGAGGIGIREEVEAALGDATPLIAAALSDLDAQAREASGGDFADLPAEQRAPLLGEVGASHPGFVEGLVFHTYAIYYRHHRVASAIGLRPGPPHPDGYELEAGDLGLLDAVRERGKLYRDA